jgi:hypothetical protein
MNPGLWKINTDLPQLRWVLNGASGRAAPRPKFKTCLFVVSAAFVTGVLV